MCIRSTSQSNPSQVMLYLKLREEGCNKQQALKYCTRHICKIDQTQKFVGPPKHRTLEIDPDPNLGIHGWQPECMMRYKLGPRFKEHRDLKETLSVADLAIVNKYKQFEQNKSQQLLQRMLAVKNYTDTIKGLELNAPNLDQFGQNVRRISTQLQESTQKPQQYIQYEGMKFYELASQMKLPQQKSQLDCNSQYQIPDPFASVMGVDPSQIKMKLRYRDNKKKSSGVGSPTKKAYQQLEDQSNLIMALQNSAGVSDAIDSTKKKRQTPSSIMLTMLKHQPQKLEMAEEYNCSQYLFTSTKAHSRQASQSAFDDEQMKSFVQNFYDKQKESTKLKTQQSSQRAYMIKQQKSKTDNN